MVMKSQDRMVFTTSAITATFRSSHHLIQFRLSLRLPHFFLQLILVFPPWNWLEVAWTCTLVNVDTSRWLLQKDWWRKWKSLIAPLSLLWKSKHFPVRRLCSREAQLDAFWRFFSHEHTSADKLVKCSNCQLKECENKNPQQEFPPQIWFVEERNQINYFRNKNAEPFLRSSERN